MAKAMSQGASSQVPRVYMEPRISVPEIEILEGTAPFGIMYDDAPDLSNILEMKTIL